MEAVFAAVSAHDVADGGSCTEEGDSDSQGPGKGGQESRSGRGEHEETAQRFGEPYQQENMDGLFRRRAQTV